MAAHAAEIEIENADFETGNLAGWSVFGPGWNVTPLEKSPHGGTYAAVVSNRLELAEGAYHGIFQIVPVRERQRYSFSALIRADQMIHAHAFLEIQWLDERKQFLHQSQSAKIERSQAFREVIIRNTRAPIGAAFASLRAIYFMPPHPQCDQSIVYFDRFRFIEE
jgi:hypothetical protein